MMYHSRKPTSGMIRMMSTQISFSTGGAPDCRMPISAQITNSKRDNANEIVEHPEPFRGEAQKKSVVVKPTGGGRARFLRAFR